MPNDAQTATLRGAFGRPELISSRSAAKLAVMAKLSGISPDVIQAWLSAHPSVAR